MNDTWTCARCSTEVVGLSFVCIACGHTRTDVPEDRSIDPPGPTETPDARVTDSVDGLAAALPTPGPTIEAAAAASQSHRRRVPIGWLAPIAIVVGIAGVGAYFAAGRSETGEIDRAGDLHAAELRVGDCFDLKDPAAEEVGDVHAVPCDVAHEFETFHSDSLPTGAFPDDDAFSTYVNDNCLPAFAEYIGLSYEESVYEVRWFQPTQEAWDSGDRSVQCAAYHPRLHRLTASIRGSMQ
jgi:hypothetical protein